MKKMFKMLSMLVAVILVVSSLSVVGFAAESDKMMKALYIKDFTKAAADYDVYADGWTDTKGWGNAHGTLVQGTGLDCRQNSNGTLNNNDTSTNCGMTYSTTLGNTFSVSGKFYYEASGSAEVRLYLQTGTYDYFSLKSANEIKWANDSSALASGIPSFYGQEVEFEINMVGGNATLTVSIPGQTPITVNKNFGSSYNAKFSICNGGADKFIIKDIKITQPLDTSNISKTLYVKDFVNNIAADYDIYANGWEAPSTVGNDHCVVNVTSPQSGNNALIGLNASVEFKDLYNEIEQNSVNRGMRFSTSLGKSFTVTGNLRPYVQKGSTDGIRFYVTDTDYFLYTVRQATADLLLYVNGVADPINLGVKCTEISNSGHKFELDVKDGVASLKIDDSAIVENVNLNTYISNFNGKFALVNNGSQQLTIYNIEVKTPLTEVFKLGSVSYNDTTKKISGTVTSEIEGIDATKVVAVYDDKGLLIDVQSFSAFDTATSLTVDITNKTSSTPKYAKLFVISGFGKLIPYQTSSRVDITSAE